MRIDKKNVSCIKEKNMPKYSIVYSKFLLLFTVVHMWYSRILKDLVWFWKIGACISLILYLLADSGLVKWVQQCLQTSYMLPIFFQSLKAVILKVEFYTKIYFRMCGF